MSRFYKGEEYFDLPEDIYGPFVGHYFVSHSGNVLSVRSTAKGIREKLLRRTDAGKGYLKVRLSSPRMRAQPLLQRLMAEVFLGLRDPDLEVDHIDGDKANNHIDNLRVVDHAENMRNAKRNGAFLTGTNNPAAKYSDELIEKARALRSNGLTLKKIECDTGIPRAYLSELLNGKKRSNSGKPYVPKHRQLTATQADDIRQAYGKREADQDQLAAKYGVSQTTISNVINMKVHKPTSSDGVPSESESSPIDDDSGKSGEHDAVLKKPA